MGHMKSIVRCSLVLGLLIGFSLAFLQAGELRQFLIQLPEKVYCNRSVSVNIVAQDAKKKTVKLESRTLHVKISNGGKTYTNVVALVRGKVTVQHTFTTPGAALITVVDPTDPTLVDYKSLVIEFDPKATK